MRSGREYKMNGTDEDYKRFEEDLGPSRHFTLIFNTFVFCQVFNFMNCRKIHEEWNVWEGKQFFYFTSSNICLGVTKNMFFCIIVGAIAGLQLLIGNLGGLPLHVSYHGMAISQWVIAIAFAAFSLVWNFILKLIPAEKLCPNVKIHFIFKINSI